MSLTDDAATFHAALLADDNLIARLGRLRGWTREAIIRLEIGVDGHRVTIPIRDASGTVVNLLRYAPNPAARTERAKMVAVKDAPRDFFPAPETIEKGSIVYLVEGEPDAITGWSLGYPCVAIPSSSSHPSTGRLERFDRSHDVVVLLDNDAPGNTGANNWAKALSRHFKSSVCRARWPQPGDDLTEVWRREGDNFKAAMSGAMLAGTVIEPRRILSLPGNEFYRRLKPRDDGDDLLGPLLRRNTRVGIAGFIGDGKTSLTLQMVAASAYGDSFFDWLGRGGDTRWLIIDLEQGESEIARRLEETGIKDRNGNVHYAHLPDGLRIDQSPEDLEALEELLSQGWDGVVLDPAYALNSSEPETESAARQFATTLDRLHRQHDFCLVVPMHTRKPQRGQVLTLQDVYGWSTITRNAQVILGIQIWKPWESKFTVLKDRTGDIGPKGQSWKIGYSRARLFHPLDGALPGQEEIAA